MWYLGQYSIGTIRPWAVTTIISENCGSVASLSKVQPNFTQIQYWEPTNVQRLYCDVYFQNHTLRVVWHQYTPSPAQFYAQVQKYKNHSLVIFCHMKFYCQTNKQKQRLISSFVYEPHFFLSHKTQTTHKHVSFYLWYTLHTSRKNNWYSKPAFCFLASVMPFNVM